jgi:hypothetical protein
MPAQGGHKSIFLEWRRQRSLWQKFAAAQQINIDSFAKIDRRSTGELAMRKPVELLATVWMPIFLFWRVPNSKRPSPFTEKYQSHPILENHCPARVSSAKFNMCQAFFGRTHIEID